MRERLVGAEHGARSRTGASTIAVRTGVNTGEVVAGDVERRPALCDRRRGQRRQALRGGRAARRDPARRADVPARARCRRGRGGRASRAEGQERSRSAPTGCSASRKTCPGRARRLDSPMVGRERELAALEQAYQRAVGRARVPPVHGSRRCGCRQVAARRRVPRRGRRRGDDHARPLPAVRRGHHLLAAGRGAARTLRRRSAGGHRRLARGRRGSSDHRANRGRGRPRREPGPARRDRLGRPPPVRGGGEALGRSSSSSTTCSGPRRRSSTSSSTWRTGRTTRRSCSSASPAPSSSTSGRAGAAASSTPPPFSSSA